MKTQNIPNKIFVNNAPVDAVNALVVGVADVMVIIGVIGVIAVIAVIAILADLLWLGGDIVHAGFDYHMYVGILLTVALIARIISFVWLYRSIKSLIAKKEKASTDKALFGVLAYDEIKHDIRGHVVKNKKTKTSPYVYFETTD